MRGQHRPENFEKWIFLKKKGVSVLTLSKKRKKTFDLTLPTFDLTLLLIPV
jgi:hypothetical protein